VLVRCVCVYDDTASMMYDGHIMRTLLRVVPKTTLYAVDRAGHARALTLLKANSLQEESVC
jgi:hypothetical protein